MGALRSNSGCLPPLPVSGIQTLTLTRNGSSDEATMGELVLPNGKQYATLERLASDPEHPCVPAGEYRLIPYESPKHGWTWCLHNPNLGVWAGGAAGFPPDEDTTRPDVYAYVEVHVGNVLQDSAGCILVGMTPDPRKPAVWSSQVAMSQIRAALGRREYQLRITG